MNMLIIGELNSTNLGDRAIFLTLRDLFESAGHTVTGLDLTQGTEFREHPQIHADPDIEDLCLSEAALPSAAETGVKRSTKQRLLAVLAKMPNDVHKGVNLFSHMRRHGRLRASWLDRLAQQHVVVFGGGALLQDNNWGFPLALAHASRLVREARLPYGCVGCSVGEAHSTRGRKWFSEFLAGASFVALRDPISSKYVQQLGVADARVFIDSAIRTSELVRRDRADKGGVIGINVLSRVRHPNVTGSGYRRYVDTMVEFLRQMASDRTLGITRIMLFNTGGDRRFSRGVRGA